MAHAFGPNLAATLYLPLGKADKMLDNGHPAEQAEGVKFLRRQGKRAVFAVESGAYQLVVDNHC